MTAPVRITPELPIVRTMQDVVDLFRLMKEHWGLTNVFCDDQGGLTSGHTDKVLGPTEERRLGYDTFALFMELCALEFVPRINMDAVKRMEAIWEQRERPLYPNAKVKRISKKLIERAKPHVIRDFSTAGGKASGLMRTGSQGSEIMRKVAKARWRKGRRKPKADGALMAQVVQPLSGDGKIAAPCECQVVLGQAEAARPQSALTDAAGGATHARSGCTVS